MTSRDQVASLRSLIALESPLNGDKPALTGWLQRMCRAAVREIPAMGVGISLLSPDGDPMTVAASSEASVLVEELQFTMGEGPCKDAYDSRSPVLVPDLGARATSTWPGYAPAAHDHGVRAVFAFPLQVGAARLGALDVYREHTGSLSRESLAQAFSFAEIAMQTLLDAGAQPHIAAELIDEAHGTPFEVYQAQGMVMVQLDIGAGEALSRMRAYAYAHDQLLKDVARNIIQRRLELESDA